MNRRHFIKTGLIFVPSVALAQVVPNRRRNFQPSTAAFNVLTDLPWDTLFMAGTNTFVTGSTPATDGQTVENLGDAIGNTKTLTQATAGKRPTYRASDALFNNKPCIEGEQAAARAMQWTRASNITAPYTVVAVGVMPAKISTYQSFVGNANGILSMWPWDSYDTGNSSETVYTQGANQESYCRNAVANIWHVGSNSTTSTHRIGRNGLNSIPAAFTAEDFGGFSLFRYPTSDALHGGGKIALVGVIPSMATSHANWSAFLGWVQSYYGISLTTRANIICDGDSRTRGYQYLDNPYHMDKLWMHLLEGRWTDSAAVSNLGVVGRTMATQVTDAATRITPMVSEMVGAKKIIITINAGINDVIGGASAATAYQSVCDYVRARRLEGFQVMIGTSPRFTGSDETKRTALNSLVVANAGDGAGGGNSIAHGVADVANDADATSGNPFGFSNATTPYTAANFNVDKIHFSTAGNVIVADKVETAMLASPFNVT